MKFNEQFLRRAIEISREKMNEGAGGPFGAVIVKDNKIIAEGWNMVTSSNDPTAHGEIVAIRDACKALNTFSLTGCELYTSAEPCPMCISAIYWARIRTVYYGNRVEDAASIGFDDKFIYEELSLPIESRYLKMEQHLHNEAYKVFEEWKNKVDKVEY